jgi:hypothetical protein
VIVAVAACGDVPTQPHPRAPSLTFGEMVYRIIRTNLVATQTCSIQYVGQLEPHHADFVTSFDFALSQSVQSDLPDLVGSTIVPVVDNGTLPALTDRVGQGLHTLVDDDTDPQRKTLTAIVDLSNSPSLVESSMATDLAAGALAAPNLRDILHSTRELLEENDGVDLVLGDLLSLATHSSVPASTCTGLELDDVQGTLLASDGFVDDPHWPLGAPGWMVRPDLHGNPAVLVDDVSGKLALPFVDNDGDGAADVDAAGKPIDAYGQVIDLPYLDTTGAHDDAGRALNSHGGVLYNYYDVKRTPLSFSMQIAADFIASGMHHHIPAIVDAVLGTPIVCNDGTSTCRAYSTTDNPLADLSFLGLELLRFPQTSQLMDVLHQLFLTDPTKAEDLLVASGDALGALQQSTISLTDTAMYDALIGIVPLIEQIFTTSNTTGKSTPRMLVDLIASMTPPEHAQIEQSLGWMLQYKSLASRPNPTPSGPAVDYTKNRFFQSGSSWVDNRSGIEQAIELLGYADCGFIGCSQGSVSTSCAAATALGGVFGHPDDGTVSEWLLGAMSSKSPSTVSSLISFINWLNGFSIPLVCNGAGCALRALGCSSERADATAAHIASLESLVNSGGLDWLLPIARVFQAQHQMPALVAIFDYIAADLWKAGTYDHAADNANSFVRRIEPPLLSAAQADAIVKLLAASDVLYGIHDAAGDPASYLLIDTADYAIAQRTVHTRLQPVAGSSIASELLKVARTASGRLVAANGSGDLSAIVGFASHYLTETTTQPDGRRVLAYPNMRMMFAVALKALSDLANLSSDDQACYVDYFEQQSAAFLTGRNFATLVRVTRQLDTSPNAPPALAYATSLLRANPSSNVEAYRPILQLTAAALSAKLAASDLSAIVSWLQVVAKDNQSTAQQTIDALDDMVQSDTSGAMIQILRNVVTIGPAGEPPASVFADTLGDVASVDTGSACELRPVMTVAVLDHTVTSLADFLTDHTNGITAIWKLVGSLAPH